MARIKLKEVTTSRVSNAIIRRVVSLPNKFSWEFSTTGQENRQALKKFKDIYKDKRCFLVANGPSLKKMNLEFLNNNISFGLNRIYLAYNDYGFKNNFLVSINDLVLKQFANELKDLDVIKFINWENRNLFINDKKTYFIYKSLFGHKFGYDISKSLNPAATVTYAALQIIYYMGFSEVIIIGLDHNFKTKTNIPNTEELRNEEKDENHFHPNYFPKGSKWETPDLTSSEYYYNVANKIFNKKKRRIIDCTINGKCPIFEKGDIRNYI